MRGQPIRIDTHNGIADGKVSRIDPAVQSGTVSVDVELVGPLLKGARLDSSVIGSIEIERIENVLHVGRPSICLDALGKHEEALMQLRLGLAVAERLYGYDHPRVAVRRLQLANGSFGRSGSRRLSARQASP